MGYIKKLKNNELVGGTDKTTIYPVTSTKAVFEEVIEDGESNFKSQKFLNNNINGGEGGRILEGTITDYNIATGTITKSKLSSQVQTMLDEGQKKALTPKGNYNSETEYEALDLVFDPVTNSSYISLVTPNVGHPVDENAEGYEEGWWEKTLDGTAVNTAQAAIDAKVGQLETQVGTAITQAETAVDEAKQETLNAYTQAEALAQQITDWSSSEISSIPSYTDQHPLSNRASSAQIGYFECGTSSATQASNQIKAVTAGGYALPTSGGAVKIKMYAANTYTPTTNNPVKLQFNADATTLKELRYNGEAVSPNNTWGANEVISVYYDGGVYQASNSQGGGGKAEKIKYDNSQSGLTSNNVQGIIDEELVSDKIQSYSISATKPNAKVFPFSFIEGKKYSITVRRISGDAFCTFNSYSDISGSSSDYVELTRLEQGETEKTKTFIATSNQFFGMWSSSGTVSAEIEIKWSEGSRINSEFYKEGQVVKETYFDCKTFSTQSNRIAMNLTKGQTYRYRVTFPTSAWWDGGAVSDSSSATILQRGTVIKNEDTDNLRIRTYEITCDADYAGFYSFLNASGTTIIEFSKVETESGLVNRFDIENGNISSLEQQIANVEDRLEDTTALVIDKNITTDTNTYSSFTTVNLTVGATYLITCNVETPLTAACGILLKKDANIKNTGEVTIASLSQGFSGTNTRIYIPKADTNYSNLCIWCSVADNNIQVTIDKQIKGDIIKRLDNLENNLDPQNYGAVYDGAIDCSSALQSCLDIGGNIVINGKGTCLLDSTVYIKKSNTHLIIGEGITILRGSNVSGALIRNEASAYAYDDERVNSNILDKIVIEGGTINLANRGGLAILLCDISNFELRNIKIKNSTSFGLLFANVYGFNIDNIVFDYSNPAMNTDGIHFRGDIQDGVIQHIYGNTGDDLVSLTPTGDYNSGGKDTRRGILDNVVVRDLFGKSSMCAIKLNTGVDTPMKKIVIDGIYGHYTYNPISIGNWMESAVFEDILIKNVHCTCDNQTNKSFEGFIRIADWKSGNTTVIDNLSIVDSYIKVTHPMNVIRNVGHTINNLMLSNIIVDVDDINLSNNSILKGGTINKVMINNVSVKAPATANKFNKFFDASIVGKALLSNSDLYVSVLGAANSLYKSNTLVNDTLV